MDNDYPVDKEKHDVNARSSSAESVFQNIAGALEMLERASDPVFCELAIRRISAFEDDVRRLAAGTIVFANTETWRAAYERVLTSLRGGEYRSVSWVKSAYYWNDLPGQHSMRLNCELLDQGLRIERLLIIGWNVWPPEARLPARSTRQWIDDQHFRGIDIKVVRESDLINEADLLRDFGIYGDRATGEQETDDESRTVRFVLSFDPASIRLAQDRWERLLLFARPYGQLLDHGLAVV